MGQNFAYGVWYIPRDDNDQPTIRDDQDS